MKKELQIRVTPKVASSIIAVRKHIAKTERIAPADLRYAKITRRSIDARQRNVVVNLSVTVYVGEDPGSEILPARIEYKPVQASKSAIVVGAGPAGLFAALRLIELGVRPIVIERGKRVSERQRDIALIAREGVVDEDSNYCFGEGGAGAFSDGKLYTRSKKRGPVEKVLGILHQHGAPESILVDAHPHIGTDRLPRVIEGIRETILRCNGEMHFSTRVTRILTSNGVATGVECANGEVFNGPVILATGHSARDVYRMLHQSGIAIEPKGIAVGVRVEHPQQLIDQIQYHSPEGRGKYLPAAEYSFVTQVDGRGVYSFCMCPGGFIVPAASSEGQLVVNGMSPANRGSRWANAGMVVEIRPDDVASYDPADPLRVMRFQEDLERRFHEAAGHTMRAGAQRLLDFVQGKPSADLPATSYSPGIQPIRVDQWLPMFVSKRLKKGFEIFGKAAEGYLTNDAIVIGVETRTSSPVRVPREPVELRHIAIAGLYPCGEGAGYAGGIVSAAIDGEKCAEALAGYLG